MASLVAVILFAVSCAASACTVRCDLGRMSPSCHERIQNKQGIQAHERLQDHGHRMAGMRAAVSLPSGVRRALRSEIAAPCEQHVCADPSVPVASGLRTALHLDGVPQASVVHLLRWPAARSVPRWVFDPVPLRKRNHVSRHTVLRV